MPGAQNVSLRPACVTLPIFDLPPYACNIRTYIHVCTYMYIHDLLVDLNQQRMPSLDLVEVRWSIAKGKRPNLTYIICTSTCN